MKLLFIILLIAFAIPAILFAVSIFTTIRIPESREKFRPYECGFDPNHSARTPFSLRFFLLAVIFLIFDVEIALLIPVPLLPTSTLAYQSLIPTFLFLLILLLGIFHE
jgi:NADH-ubiquinone oxidoreductase chain 3